MTCLKTLLMTALMIALASCAGPITRLDMSTARSDLSLRALVGTVMVRSVSLPSYAAAEEVSVETAPGIITAQDDLLWSDDPSRAVTLALASQMDDILTATVGPEPWPFAGLPDVSVDIRIMQMLAGVDGVFRLSGDYYVGGDGIDFPNSAHDFAISEPVDPTDLSAVAAAQGRSIVALAEDIARRLGR